MAEDTLAQPSMGSIDLIDVLKALGDPGRLSLLGRLADGEFHRCSEWLPELDMHKSTLSHHLKVLRQAGLTSTRVIGREHEIRLRVDELNARFPGLVEALVAAIAEPAR